jgi:hypothetical protein
MITHLPDGSILRTDNVYASHTATILHPFHTLLIDSEGYVTLVAVYTTWKTAQQGHKYGTYQYTHHQ